MSQRHEFVMLFEQDGVNRRELCRRFGVSPTIGYRLWARWRAAGKAGLADRSRRPQHAPGRSSAAMEGLVLAVREAHPAWGGRKIRRRLQDLKHQAVPSASTITAILHRHGRIEPAASAGHKAFERFERAAPNELWQMDYADGLRRWITQMDYADGLRRWITQMDYADGLRRWITQMDYADGLQGAFCDACRALPPADRGRRPLALRHWAARLRRRARARCRAS